MLPQLRVGWTPSLPAARMLCCVLMPAGPGRAGGACWWNKGRKSLQLASVQSTRPIPRECWSLLQACIYITGLRAPVSHLSDSASSALVPAVLLSMPFPWSLCDSAVFLQQKSCKSHARKATGENSCKSGSFLRESAVSKQNNLLVDVNSTHKSWAELTYNVASVLHWG